MIECRKILFKTEWINKISIKNTVYPGTHHFLSMNIHQTLQTKPPFKSLINHNIALCRQDFHYINRAVQWYKVAKAKSSPHHPRWNFSANAFALNQSFSPMHQRPSGHFYQSTPNDTIHHKILALKLYPLIKNVLSTACMHIKNHGGRKEAAHHVQKNLNHYPYLYKSDIFSYYASIDRPILMNMVSKHVHSKNLVSRIHAALHRDVEMGGNFRPIDGLPMGCSLSPLLGALYLTPLDNAMTKRKGIFYVRYMDDFIIMGKTKSIFKSAIKHAKIILSSLKVREHPDKTQYLRTHNVGVDNIVQEKISLDYLNRVVDAQDVGFDFLGYHISKNGIRLRRSTAQKMIETKTRPCKKRYFKKGSVMAELKEPYWIQPLKKRQKRTDTAFKKSPKNTCLKPLLGGAANSIKKTKNTNAPMPLNGFIKTQQKPKGITFGDVKLKIKKCLCPFKGLGNVFKNDLNGFYNLILDFISPDLTDKKNGIFLNRMMIWMVFKRAGYG